MSPLFSVSAQPLVLAGVIMDFLNTRGFPESWRRGLVPVKVTDGPLCLPHFSENLGCKGRPPYIQLEAPDSPHTPGLVQEPGPSRSGRCGL